MDALQKRDELSPFGKKLPKPPKPPEKPLMPYMRYSRQIWDQVKASNRDSKLWEIGRVIGQRWRELPTDQKQKYIDEYESEKNHYGEALRQYQSSAAYQQYLAAKEKALAEPTGRDEVITKAPVRVDTRPTAIEVNYDEVSGADDGVQAASATRYARNQRLMLDILNDMSVPDVRAVVTVPRLQMLKRQTQSLTLHQKKLDAELTLLADRFQSKRRCIDEQRTRYAQTLEQLSVPAAETAHYDKLIDTASERLLHNYALYKEQQEARTGAEAESQ